MRNDLSIIKFLEALHSQINEGDDSSFDNTVIQFFEAPHDNETLTALILAYVNGLNIPMTANDTETLTALINAQTTDPATLTWGGYDGGGTYWNAGWAWGYGGVYKGTKTSLAFDGVNDYVNCGNDASLNLTATFTVECWIYPLALGGYIADKNTRNYLQGWAFGFTTSELYARIHDGTTGTDFIFTSLSPVTNQWQHVCLVRDNNSVTVYLNGAGQTLSVSQGNTLTTTEPLYIGRGGAFSTSECFKGSIDDVRIWNVARTQAQIQANMNNQLVGNETGLVGYWKFDEMRGLTAFDSTSNHNDGTLTNGPTWVYY